MIPQKTTHKTITLFLRALALAILPAIVCAGAAHAALPAAPCFSDDFNYAYGSSLNDSPAWDGSATSEIAISSDGYYVKMTGGLSSVDSHHVFSPAYQGKDNIIWVHFKMMPGSGGATMWNLWLDDASGNNLARCYGSATSYRGRIGGSSTVTAPVELAPGWNDLDVRLDTKNNTSEFFINGGSLGVLDHGTTPANALSRIKFERMNNSSADGHYLYFDEIVVGEQPQPTEPPKAPVVTLPVSGSVIETYTSTIQWTPGWHDKYEVHVNTTNNPADSDGWDSGEVTSSAVSCITDDLSNRKRYYVFVRLHNSAGWGPWSASGCCFDVNVPLRIIPEPQEFTRKTGDQFRVNAQTRIVVNANPDSKDTFTANQLRRKVWDTTGFLPAIVEGGPGAPTDNVIAIGDPDRNTAVASIVAGWPDAAGKTPKSEGYMLGVKDGSVLVRGFDQSGTFYGCQTLIQLLEYYGTAIDPAFCYDYPDLAWRGTMVRVRNGLDVNFTKEVVSEVMARFKMNVLELHISYGVLWPSHPELFYDRTDRSEVPTTFPEIKEVADFARQHFIEVIPSGVSWTHSWEWQTAEDLNTDLLESVDPRGGNMCPRKPAGQKLIHDLIQDQIDAFNPKYIHMGWDEIGDIGVCEYCRGEDPAVLFSDYLKNDRDYLAARGITTLIWADMLRPDMNGGAPRNLYRTVETMPKDIIVSDWFYTGHHEDFPTLKTWNDNGLRSLAAPYGGYEPWSENIYSWCQAAKRHNILGMVAFNKYRCGTKQNVFANPYQSMEVGNFVFYGEWGWTPDKPGYSPAPYDGKAIVRRQVSPDTPRSFGASLAGRNVELYWTNPPDNSFEGMWVCYRTDRYPVDPTDGIFVADVKGSPGGAGSVTHTSAPLGATLYYAAFSHDDVRRFSPSATASVGNGSPLSLTDLSSQPDGSAVNVSRAVVTAVYETCFYVENETRTSGLRVESTESVSVGNVVTVNGTLGKTGKERSLSAASVAVTGQKEPPIGPLALTNAALGGSDKGYVPGSGGVGVNNVGLLTTTWGKRLNVSPDGTYFYVTDGSSTEGVKVILAGTTTPIAAPSAEYVCVTGVSSLDSNGKAIIRPRSQADIVPVR